MFKIKLKKKQQQKLKFVIYWLYNLLNLYRKLKLCDIKKRVIIIWSDLIYNVKLCFEIDDARVELKRMNKRI